MGFTVKTTHAWYVTLHMKQRKDVLNFTITVFFSLCYLFFQYTIQKPKVNQLCLPEIGCSNGYTCDVNSPKCRKPELNETCSFAVGCQDGLTCKKNWCTKPSLKEACIVIVGCSDGYVCRNSTCQVCHSYCQNVGVYVF